MCSMIPFSDYVGFPGNSDGKESTCNSGEPSLIPGSGRSPGEGNSNSLQYSCLENPIHRGAWWAIVHGVAKSRMLRKQLSTHKMFREGFCQNDKKLKDTILERERKKPRSQEICIWNPLKLFASSKPFFACAKKDSKEPSRKLQV